MIDRNHPAVEAANEAATRWLEAGWDEAMQLPEDGTAYMLTAALPHLTVDDLRDTPAGRALMAEACDMGWAGGAYGKDRHDNPHAKDNA